MQVSVQVELMATCESLPGLYTHANSMPCQDFTHMRQGVEQTRGKIALQTVKPPITQSAVKSFKNVLKLTKMGENVKSLKKKNDKLRVYRKIFRSSKTTCKCCRSICSLGQFVSNLGQFAST